MNQRQAGFGLVEVMVGLVIGLVLIIGGYLVWQSSTAPTTPQLSPTLTRVAQTSLTTEPTQIAVATATPISNSTVGWETFTPFGYSVKHPPTWVGNRAPGGMEPPVLTSPGLSSVHFYQFQKEALQSLDLFSQQQNEVLTRNDCFPECPQVELSDKNQISSVTILRYRYTKKGSLHQVVYYMVDESNPIKVAMLIVQRGVGDKELPMEILDKIAQTATFYQ